MPVPTALAKIGETMTSAKVDVGSSRVKTVTPGGGGVGWSQNFPRIIIELEHGNRSLVLVVCGIISKEGGNRCFAHTCRLPEGRMGTASANSTLRAYLPAVAGTRGALSRRFKGGAHSVRFLSK